MAEEKPKEVDVLMAEAKTLGLDIPRLSIAGLRSKDPKNVAKEEARQAKQLVYLLKVSIEKAKEKARTKPIKKRRALLVSRFKAVKARDRAFTYSDANIKAWLEELNLIDSNPKSWNKITAKGTLPFTPSNKKKKSARDILDGMDFED